MDIHQIRKTNMQILLFKVSGSYKDLAKAIDTDPSYISQILSEKGNRNVGSNLARRLEIAFSKSAGWMDKDNPRERMMVNSKQKLDGVLHQVKENSPSYIIPPFKVPELDIRASMGNGDGDNGEGGIVRTWDIDQGLLLREGIEPKDAVLISCVGQSMESTLFEKDIVLVDKGAISNFGFEPGVYALRTQSGIKIKRLNQKMTGEIEVISDNIDKTKYPTESYAADAADDFFEVVGKVVRKFWGRVV